MKNQQITNNQKIRLCFSDNFPIYEVFIDVYVNDGFVRTRGHKLILVAVASGKEEEGEKQDVGGKSSHLYGIYKKR